MQESGRAIELDLGSCRAGDAKVHFAERVIGVWSLSPRTRRGGKDHRQTDANPPRHGMTRMLHHVYC